jgi:thymidylate synthase (FAD)
VSIKEDKQQEINEIKQEEYKTFRATVPELEKILYEPLKVLDKGFVRVIDYMGDDSAIVQAARVSYGKGTKKTSQDKGLIFYLMRHRHTTPLEMCEIKFHIKLPIFIARQWIRHRTANVNEYSARYSILANEFYVPARDQLAAQSKTNMQGRDKLLNDEEAKRVQELLIEDATRSYSHYQEMLNENEAGEIFNEEKSGLTRELARMNLSTNFYTEWYWKIDLHNLFHFLSLRADSHAQYEIRAYAEVMLDIVKKWVPFAYEAFIEYRKDGASVSAKGREALRKMVKGKKVTQQESGMSPREWREFVATFDIELEDA